MRLGSVGNQDLVEIQGKLAALRSNRDLSKVLTSRELTMVQTQKGRQELIERLKDNEEYFRTRPNM